MRNTLGGDGNGFPRVSRRPGEAGLHTVPRWEDLVADPSKAGVLDAHTARIVATKALGVFVASFYRCLRRRRSAISTTRQAGRRRGETAVRAVRRTLPGLDDVASVEEVAGILGKPRRWIIQNAATLAVRDAGIAEALRLLQDCTETMACDSAARAEGPMTDRSGTGGIGSISALPCGTACFQSDLRRLSEIAARGVDPSRDPSVA